MKKMFMAVIAMMMTISASAQFYIYCSDGNVIKVDSISLVAQTEKVLFYKIVQPSEIGPVLQSANTYNPLTENNLINDLGFSKYTKDNNGVSITGGWCLIMSPLNISEISAIDALGLNISITNTNKNIGEYKVYYIQLDKSSTATIKIN